MGFSLNVALKLFAVVIAIMVFYNLVIKVYVLPKIKINKWIIFTLGIIMFFVTNLVGVKFKITYNKFGVNEIPYYLCMALVLLLFLIFFDLAGWGTVGKRASRKDGKKDVVIRPKAKPNRVKNKKNE